jgi:type I restriction enzyme M protein
MGAIEREFEPLLGQLPKEYGEFEPTVLENLMRVFDSETLRTAGGDVFGRIYEYFLMKFAMQGAQDNHRGDLRPRKALEPWYSVL